jgi:hypothetical protein
MKKGFKAKTKLEPIEKLKVAYLHEVTGIDTHQLCVVFGVNPGRISEAITDVRLAVGLKIDEEENDEEQ